jgi:hypothetical protein
LNDFGRKLIRTTEACAGGVAGVIGLICTIDTIRGDQNPLINEMWIVAAALVVVTAALEVAHQHYDDRDFDAMRDELDVTKKIADDFARQSGPWRISESSSAAIKESLSAPEYAGQEFIVYREYENIDGEPFANDLQKILVDCGWFGIIEILTDSIPYMFPRGVSVWTSESITSGDIVKMPL